MCNRFNVAQPTNKIMENEITTIESQREMILRHLQENGFITPNEAEALYGCKRLASRINELRKNFRISTTLEQGRNRFGKPMRYAKYIYHSDYKCIEAMRAKYITLEIKGVYFNVAYTYYPDCLCRECDCGGVG